MKALSGRSGLKLREMRLERNLTLKQVENTSMSFAQEQGNAAYRISASWLNRLERGTHDLSLSKLVLLAHVYRLTPEQLLGNLHPGGGIASLLRHSSRPGSTVLLDSGPLDEQAQYLLQGLPSGDDFPDKTRLLSHTEKRPVEVRYLHGVIGRHDSLLSPLVPPGAIVVIDTRQKAFATGKNWKSEFDRPIYFLLTHDSYVCAWCDFDKASDWLTVVPHPLSEAAGKRWKYRREIENLGRVVMVTAPWGL